MNRTPLFLLSILLPLSTVSAGTEILDRCLVLKTLITESALPPEIEENSDGAIHCAAQKYARNQESRKIAKTAYDSISCDEVLAEALGDPELATAVGLKNGRGR